MYEGRELEIDRMEHERVRKFDTGATRSQDAGRDDPEGYLSPLVLDRYNEYMTKHRQQPDGSVRASDNWQRGMPLDTYMKGAWRHFLHLWTRHRGYPVRDPGAAVNNEEDLCALLFNVQGYLHELIKRRLTSDEAHRDVAHVRGACQPGCGDGSRG